jgi:putative ubiquitin-RnfH superfamily antitoxin RatB of RatAB toxin-antitoxin module
MAEAPQATVLLATVVWATASAETIVPVRVNAGATLLDAVRASAIAAAHPEIDLDTCRVGVWGRLKALDAMLKEGDRVEIYRPMTADPNTARQRRVAKKRAGAGA